MNRYWMEDSFGKYGVELTPFGPYRMPAPAYQYFISAYAGTQANTYCPTPTVTPCNRNIRTDLRAAWLADVGDSTSSTPTTTSSTPSPARTRARRGRSSAR